MENLQTSLLMNDAAATQSRVFCNSVGILASQLRRATISNPVTGVLETAPYRISKR